MNRSATDSQVTYPKRDPFFAHRLVRLMMKACAAQEIGTDAAYLVSVVVHTEDAKRYSGPVTFYNAQLLPILGFGKWERLEKARRAAVEAGWLHYEPRGNRQPGRYWALVPIGVDRLGDRPVDESTYPGTSPESGDDVGVIQRDDEGHGRGDVPGVVEGYPPTLNPSPLPSHVPEKKPGHAASRLSTADVDLAQWMFTKIRELNPDHSEPNFEKWSHEVRLMRERDGRNLDTIRDLFQWANAHEFWRTVILSPAKLRAKWDQLTIQRTKGQRRHGTENNGAHLALAGSREFDERTHGERETKC